MGNYDAKTFHTRFFFSSQVRKYRRGLMVAEAAEVERRLLVYETSYLTPLLILTHTCLDFVEH